MDSPRGPLERIVRARSPELLTDGCACNTILNELGAPRPEILLRTNASDKSAFRDYGGSDAVTLTFVVFLTRRPSIRRVMVRTNPVASAPAPCCARTNASRRGDNLPQNELTIFRFNRSWR
jgi:hypothetical protein